MNLFKAVSSVSGLTLASRITGLVREQLGAALFGAGASMDAFQIAFRIPNLLRRLFAEGAFSQAFVPLLAASRAADGDAATRGLIDAVATVLAWALVATVALGVVGAPALVWLLASGFDAPTEALAARLTRIMFPYIGFMSMVALASGVLNTWKRFALPAATPVLLNLAVIAAALALVAPLKARGIDPVFALAAGVMLGGVLQLAVQLPALARLGLLPRLGATPRRLAAAWRHPGVRTVLAKMGPALIGVSVAQLSLMINSQIASHLGVGAVSTLNYADRLMELPIGLLGVALGVVLTPQMSAARAAGDAARYSALVDWGLRLALLLAWPCAVALVVFAAPLVAALYHRGAFGDAAVAATAPAVAAWGVGLVGLVGLKIAAPAFYAQHDTATPMKVALATLVLTQLLNAVFVGGLGLGVASLALSIGLAAVVNTAALLVLLARGGGWRPHPGWAGFALKVVVAGAAMGGWLAWLAHALDWLALRRGPSGELLRAAAMAGALASSAAIYFAALAALRLRWLALLRRM